jgi:TolA-binding protein
MEEAFNAYKLSTNARLKVLEDAASSTGAPLGGETGTIAVPPVTSATPATTTTTPTPARGPGAGNGVLGQSRPSGPAPAATTTPARPAVVSGARAEQIAAVERPATGDAAEDLYVYGFRLWQAKLYPEARVPLAEVVAKHPKHRRASFAQNLLGRAWLDEGKSAEAAKAFYDSYIKMPDGERAADSLFYLSQALQKLKAAPAEQCKVYKALELDYPGKLSLDQQAVIDRGKAAAKCS